MVFGRGFGSIQMIVVRLSGLLSPLCLQNTVLDSLWMTAVIMGYISRGRSKQSLWVSSRMPSDSDNYENSVWNSFRKSLWDHISFLASELISSTTLVACAWPFILYLKGNRKILSVLFLFSKFQKNCKMRRNILVWRNTHTSWKIIAKFNLFMPWKPEMK